MGKMMKILFISHDSSYTGAPLLLLQLMDWIKSTKECSVQSILLYDGLLSKDFRKLGKVLIIDKTGGTFRNILVFVITRFFPSLHRLILNYRIKQFVNSYNPGLVYVNSVASLKILPAIKKSGNYPVLCHVHELEYGIDLYLGSSIFRSLVHLIDRFIANSKATKNNLINKYYIPAEKIDVVRPHIQIDHQNSTPQNIFKELSIDQGTFIVMGCGFINWFKGIELFIYTASELAKRTDKKFKFLWIGAQEQEYIKKLPYEISTLGLQDKVEFIGFRNNASDYFGCADVLFISSREESFGMVGLEAALKSVPVICFDTSEGMKEFIGNDAGFIIPYPDYKGAAKCIFEIMNNPALKKQMGKDGHKKVLEEASIETTGPKIWSVIRDVVEGIKD